MYMSSIILSLINACLQEIIRLCTISRKIWHHEITVSRERAGAENGSVKENSKARLFE